MCTPQSRCAAGCLQQRRKEVQEQEACNGTSQARPQHTDKHCARPSLPADRSMTYGLSVWKPTLRTSCRGRDQGGGAAVASETAAVEAPRNWATGRQAVNCHPQCRASSTHERCSWPPVACHNAPAKASLATPGRCWGCGTHLQQSSSQTETQAPWTPPAAGTTPQQIVALSLWNG
jgi:hypothetical protein